jgi:hypothetical protein
MLVFGGDTTYITTVTGPSQVERPQRMRTTLQHSSFHPSGRSLTATQQQLSL